MSKKERTIGIPRCERCFSSKEAGDQLFSILIVAWLNLPQGRTGLDTGKKVFLALRLVKHRRDETGKSWDSVPWTFLKSRSDKHPSELI